jgi:hypothetical protein
VRALATSFAVPTADARRRQRTVLHLAGDVDACWERRRPGVEAVDVERDLDLLGLIEIVVGDDGNGDLVALAQEARCAHADDDVLADDDAVDSGAGLRVRGDGADGGAPGGERVGEGERDAGVALRVGVEDRRPVGGVGEGFADFGLAPCRCRA